MDTPLLAFLHRTPPPPPASVSPAAFAVWCVQLGQSALAPEADGGRTRTPPAGLDLLVVWDIALTRTGEIRRRGDRGRAAGGGM